MILIIAMLASGCAGAQTAMPQSSDSTESNDSNAPSNQTESETEPVKLTMWSWRFTDEGFVQLFNEVKDEFEASNPGVSIELVSEPYEGYVNKITAALATGNAPDIVHVLIPDYQSFVKQGWLAPIDNYLADTDIVENWPPQQETVMKIGGVTYGLLMENYADCLLYNKELFADAELPGPPESFDQFVEYAHTLTKDSNGAHQFGYTSGSGTDLVTQYMFSIIVIGAGANWTDGNGNWTIDTPEMIKAFETYKDFYETGVIPKGMQGMDSRKLFHEGNAAMYIDGSWGVTQTLDADPAMLENLGVVTVPFPIRGGASNALTLPANGKHNDLAWEFIKIWTQPKYQEKYNALVGIAPRANSVPEDLIKEQPWTACYADAVQNAAADTSPTDIIVNQTEFTDAILTRLSEVLIDNQPIPETVILLQSDLEALTTE